MAILYSPITIGLSFTFGMVVSSYLSSFQMLETPKQEFIIRPSCKCPKCPDPSIAANATVIAAHNAIESNTVIPTTTTPTRVESVATNSDASPKEKEEPVAKQASVTRDNESLFGQFCHSSIVGEKQTWNKHKKVISFSVFSPKPNQDLPDWVEDGVRIQVLTAKKFYPDWVLRFHTVDLSPELEQELIAHDNVEIVRCIRFASKSRMMIHRFLVLDDPTVEYALIRDGDSRFTLRELMAVNEWMASGLPFHVMRDHKQHMVHVVGCCFDMRRGLLESSNTTMTQLFQQAVEQFPNKELPGSGIGEDQAFLERYIWSKVRNETLTHDSNRRCRRPQYETKTCQDFPLGPRNQAEYYFVGAPFKEKDTHTSNMTGHECTLDCKAV